MIDLVGKRKQLLGAASFEESFETYWFFRGVPLDVLLLFIYVLELVDKGRGGFTELTFLFLFAQDDEALLFKLHVFFFVLVSLRLPIKEFHQRYMIDYGVGIVDEYKLLLTIIEHLVCPLPRHMHQEKV